MSSSNPEAGKINGSGVDWSGVSAMAGQMPEKKIILPETPEGFYRSESGALLPKTPEGYHREESGILLPDNMKKTESVVDKPGGDFGQEIRDVMAEEAETEKAFDKPGGDFGQEIRDVMAEEAALDTAETATVEADALEAMKTAVAAAVENIEGDGSAASAETTSDSARAEVVDNAAVGEKTDGVVDKSEAAPKADGAEKTPEKVLEQKTEKTAGKSPEKASEKAPEGKDIKEILKVGKDIVPDYMQDLWMRACKEYSLDEMQRISKTLEALKRGDVEAAMKEVKENSIEDGYVMGTIAMFDPSGIELIEKALKEVYGAPNEHNKKYLADMRTYHERKRKEAAKAGATKKADDKKAGETDGVEVDAAEGVPKWLEKVEKNGNKVEIIFGDEFVRENWGLEVAKLLKGKSPEEAKQMREQIEKARGLINLHESRGKASDEQWAKFVRRSNQDAINLIYRISMPTAKALSEYRIRVAKGEDKKEVRQKQVDKYLKTLEERRKKFYEKKKMPKNDNVTLEARVQEEVPEVKTAQATASQEAQVKESEQTAKESAEAHTMTPEAAVEMIKKKVEFDSSVLDPKTGEVIEVKLTPEQLEGLFANMENESERASAKAELLRSIAYWNGLSVAERQTVMRGDDLADAEKAKVANSARVHLENVHHLIGDAKNVQEEIQEAQTAYYAKKVPSEYWQSTETSPDDFAPKVERAPQHFAIDDEPIMDRFAIEGLDEGYQRILSYDTRLAREKGDKDKLKSMDLVEEALKRVASGKDLTRRQIRRLRNDITASGYFRKRGGELGRKIDEALTADYQANGYR